MATLVLNLGNLLEEYGEIAAILPVLTGLLVTTQLRLRGASALVVNIAIAAVTRQVIVQASKKTRAGPMSRTTPVLVPLLIMEAAATEAEDYTIVTHFPDVSVYAFPVCTASLNFANRLRKNYF